MRLTVRISLVAVGATTFTTTTFAATRFLLRSEVGGEVLLAIDFATANPNLDTEDTYLREGFTLAVVDIRTESVKGRTAFFKHFTTCDFSAIQTTANLDFDTYTPPRIAFSMAFLMARR